MVLLHTILFSTQLKSNSELKAMFDQHYPNLVLLTSPLVSLKASVPKMTLLDSETIIIDFCCFTELVTMLYTSVQSHTYSNREYVHYFQLYYTLHGHTPRKVKICVT